MNLEKRRKWASILEKWGPFIMIACTLFGAILGSVLFYIFSGEFPYEVVAGALIMSIILAVYYFIKIKRKKDNIPEVDERVKGNIFNFFAYSSHIFLSLLFISLPIFTLLGNESIPILYLWIFFFSYIWVVGIGTILIKRR